MIRLSKSVIGNEEIKAVTKVLQEEFLGMGTETQKFENELSSFFNRETVCVNSGTAALHLALQAVGINKGDEVLVQSLTFLASFQAISATGAKPIPCEINEETFTIDLKDAASKITAKTKAIMPVHYASNVGDLNAIYSFAKKNKLRVIEDAAHAFGTFYKERLIGSFGDIVCFSFDGIKNITAGEGGAVVSNDKDVIQRIKNLRLLAVENDSALRYKNKRTWDSNVIEQGWRFHMSNIMAAIGRVQLKRFDTFKRKRQSLALQYSNKLSKVKYIKIFDFDFTKIVPHIYVIRILNGQRDVIKQQLLEKGIQTGIHYKPNHLLDFYKGDFELMNTEQYYSEILTLPLHPDLSKADINYICTSLKALL